MRIRLRSTLPLLAVLSIAACDDAAGPDAGTLTAGEAAALSEAMVDADFATTGEVATAADPVPDAAVSAAPMTATTEFTHARSCPVSGRVVVEGTRVREWDRVAHTGSSDLSLVKTHEACARLVEGVAITVDGDPNVAVQAHHAWIEGRRDGLQTLTMQGGLAWSADDGREGSCTIDVSAVFDPETRTRTVSGTFCNQTFERTTTWTGGGQGGMGS